MRPFPGWRNLLPIILIGSFVFSVAADRVGAAALTTLRDYLSEQQANLTSGQVHQFFFTPATSLGGSGNTLELSFPTNQSTLWCRTAGADLTVTSLTDPVGATESATGLPGTLVAACTQGNGSSTGDTIVVTGVGPLNSGTKYGVRISGTGTATLGTPGPANSILINVKTTNGTIDIDTGMFWTAVLSDDNVVITATVASGGSLANPTIQFKGRASLDTQVKFFRDGSEIQSVPVDGNAKFDVTLTNQPTGNHTYEITANDSDGRQHASVTFAFNLALGSTTLISGIFLGPTIDVVDDQVKLGETVTIFGKTAPSSTVTLTVNSDPQVFNLTADAAGDWSQTFNSTIVGVGSHAAQAEAMAESTLSETSLQTSFAVDPLGPCDGKPTADSNCDGEVNLTDFSIMLFFWQSTNPANTRVDMNHDGIVNIVDFSIMLFQWTD